MSKYDFKILELKKSVRDQDPNEVDQLYREWKRVFGKVLNEKGAQLDHDDFFRQDLAFILKQEQQIMGMVLGTYFDLRMLHHREHHYLAEVPQEVVQSLTKNEITNIMSIEYLTLHADCRKPASDILWSEALMALALFHSDTVGVSGVIGRPRLDLKVKESLTRLGCRTLHEGISKMNYLCSVEFMPARIKRSFFNPQTEKTVQELWASRTYSSEETRLKIAA